MNWLFGTAASMRMTDIPPNPCSMGNGLAITWTGFNWRITISTGGSGTPNFRRR
ncbi:hypothetical protein DSM104299_00212 [Baekduia alba]|nr:hypothetical protein DSM104299_00212 [Baekduia alba]